MLNKDVIYSHLETLHERIHQLTKLTQDSSEHYESIDEMLELTNSMRLNLYMIENVLQDRLLGNRRE